MCYGFIFLGFNLCLAITVTEQCLLSVYLFVFFWYSINDLLFSIYVFLCLVGPLFQPTQKYFWVLTTALSKKKKKGKKEALKQL